MILPSSAGYHPPASTQRVPANQLHVRRVSIMLLLTLVVLLPAGAMASTLLRKPAPSFVADAVINEEFQSISDAYFKDSWGVLFFYPADFTFVCPTEIQAFSDRVAEFTAVGTKVAAVSVDSKHSHLAWILTPREKGGLGKMNIPVIADLTKSISRAYGVLIEDPHDPDCGVSYRATFIIDPKGIIRHVSVNDLPVGRSVDEILRLINAFQFTEEHGEVCPANWKPGARTMKPDPKLSKEYFAAMNAAAAGDKPPGCDA